MIDTLLKATTNGPAHDLLVGLFGPTRQLYKRAIECSVFQHRELYAKLARRPYPWLAACSEQFAGIISHELTRRVAPHEILFDAPPVQLEVEFDVDVYFPNEDCYRPLGEISPVVSTLARKQFDDYVKRVRVYVHPQLLDELRRLGDLAPLLEETIRRME